MLGNIVVMAIHLGRVLISILTGDFTGAFEALKDYFNSVLDLIDRVWTALKSMLGAGKTIWGGITSLFGDGGGDPNLQGITARPGAGTALGSNNVSNQQQTNQNVNQQTSINITGGADAQAIGKQVASEQNRVNFDMTRNMKGATR